MGGYIGRFTWCHTDISLYLPISWDVTLTFPDIFLLVDCFAWALIDCIEKWRVNSELWQFWMGKGGEGRGGYIIRFTWCHTDISLYLPISWLFQMGSHWLHWKAKSSLWALAVLNGEGGEGRGGGIIVSFTWVNLKIWAHLPFYALLHRRSFHITYERPNNKDWTSGLNEKDTQIGAKGMASRASTSDKQEIATNTSNLHLTSRVRVELDSSLQGYLKALSKLTRGIERANHHTDLLQSSWSPEDPQEDWYQR